MVDTYTNTSYPDPPKPYLVDVGDYLFYHMLHVEYLVHFSKNPAPYQKPLSLPYCGLEPYDETHRKRGWPKLPEFEGAVKKIGSEIAKGVAGIRKCLDLIIGFQALTATKTFPGWNIHQRGPH